MNGRMKLNWSVWNTSHAQEPCICMYKGKNWRAERMILYVDVYAWGLFAVDTGKWFDFTNLLSVETLQDQIQFAP